MKRSSVVCSDPMREYFEHLSAEANRCYEVAEQARNKGKDPETFVEIPQAEDLAARVEELVGPPRVAGRIRELSQEYSREEVSIHIAKEIAHSLKNNREKALDQAIRTGLAVLTEGILVAPLEGVVGVKILKNADGKECVSVLFAGPIRSAGGTGQAMSVLIADVVRRELGLAAYEPTQREVERYKEEVSLYGTLQYTPSDAEIDLIIKHCPVCMDGEGTEKEEVSGNRDLPRVEGNRVRGGALLVMAEGVCQKANKIQKHVRKLGIGGWEFIDKYLDMRKGGGKKKGTTTVEPNFKYIKDILAGRPILSYPSREGGFRLRYGRGRTTGLASLAIHPSTMHILLDVIAVGTQMKIERPGKACVATPNDSLDGPIVLLHNGELVQLSDASEAIKVKDDIARIIDLGEILVPYGEFAENNHVLMPGSYCHEWWAQELEEAGGKCDGVPAYKEAIALSEKHGIPLHPSHTLFWHDLSADEISSLEEYALANGEMVDGKLLLPMDKDVKELLIRLGALHKEGEENYVLEHFAPSLIRCLGLGPGDDGLTRVRSSDKQDPMERVAELAGIPVKPRAPSRIGARMGRPEKAKERKMSPPPHVLFPLGDAGGSQRLVKQAAEKGKIPVEVGLRKCKECGRRAAISVCQCGGHTVPVDKPMLQYLELGRMLNDAASGLRERVPDIKGVKGMVSSQKTPEILEKGILRAKHNVFVFKDGTIRYDMTDVPLTHFRPSEIGLSVEQARKLGYVTDIHGKKLTRTDQLVELKVQDFIAAKTCGEYMVRASNFVDDELEKVYGLPRFYNAQNPSDLIGQMMVGLAPHTSGGVLVRLIGYVKSRIGLGHPFFHAAKRRNCDGDEDCVMLLMDGLLNFSRTYLPKNRGGLMDAPLVLTTRIDPSEIDKEAHNIDVCDSYPLEFYRAAERFAQPSEVEDIIDRVGSRIDSALQYEGFSFTHDTSDISEGPSMSAYSSLETMMDKMDIQLDLAKRIRAVDQADTAARIINTHFLPDLMGNLKKFSTQKVRCVKCNAKYRRIPLSGVCTKPLKGNGNGARCGGKLTLTVHKGGVTKYLQVTKDLAKKYNIKNYTQQRVELIENAINSLFENDKVKTCSLEDFM